MISIEKAINGQFEEYDAIYSPISDIKINTNTFCKPSGRYICCYHKGKWDTIPIAYKKIFDFAKNNNLTPTGYAYEIGMNELVISKEDDYITKIMIKVE